ncbi:hypothetical protein THIOSC15_2720017 [uncultured Thiomicrorhabdus sp.]
MKTPDEIYLFEHGEEIVWADTDESHELDKSVAYVKMEKYKELEQQNAELTAHCGEQREFLNKVANMYSSDFQDIRFEARALIHKTESHSLANIQADAIEEFKRYILCKNLYLNVSIDAVFSNYANKLREKGK